MLFSKAIQLFLSSIAMLSQPAPQALAQASLDELLSYECAKSVSTMVNAAEQPGPIFSDGLLALTSVEAADGSHLLIVNAGAGTFAVPLEHEGVNRVRFYLPTHLPGGPKAFFISYLHGSNMRSRVFELSSARPVLGKEVLDYDSVPVHRAENMLEHFDYAIYETAGKLLAALTEGRMTRASVEKHQGVKCDHISRHSPGIARNLKRDLDVVEMIVMGPTTPKARSTGRMPASIEARRF